MGAPVAVAVPADLVGAPASAPPPAPEPAPASEPGPAVSNGTVDAASLNDAIPELTAQLKRGTAAIYRNGRFAGIDGDVATFVLDNAPTRDRAERGRDEVEHALSDRLGRTVPLRLVEESQVAGDVGSPAATPAPAVDDRSEETIDLDDLVPADVTTSVVDKLAAHFPGATMMDEEAP